MALRALMLRKRLDEAKKSLEELRASNDFETREAELEQAINEAETDEEKQAVEEEVGKFEADKKEYEEQEAKLDAEVRQLESDLAEVEKAQEVTTPAPVVERKEIHKMETRKFFRMNAQERDAFFANDEVQAFLQRMRDMKGQNRSVSGAELLIPTVVLELIRENIMDYSKLYRHVNVRPVSGKARQTVMGVIPEAVWTEMCGVLNELDISFGGVEVDGYKVGGFVAICNATLEDSDINLAEAIITALGQAIGLALDKAILYGTGTKMPRGIVPRLVETAEPAGNTSTIPWKDLHTKNVKTIPSSATGQAFFRALVLAAGNAKGKYSRGIKFWAMNEQTYTAVIAEALSINAAGAIVTGIQATMPVIGGDIEVLDFIPDNVIVGGYGDLYLLAERADTSIQQSEHAQFIQDNTVFKGTARYDGLPVIAEGFVAIGINGVTPTGDMTFAPDVANEPAEISGLAIGSLTLTPAFDPATLTYTAATTDASNKVNVTTDGDVNATITVNGTAIKNGAAATWSAGENTVVVTASAPGVESTVYTVTVTKS